MEDAKYDNYIIMAKSLLDIIAENKRRRDLNKNIDVSDDVQKSGNETFTNNRNTFSRINYTDDSNKESESVESIGDRVRIDRQDLNISPQNQYETANANNRDANVIDMPEIDDISENIYLNRIKYNKYASLDYTPIEVSIPQGVTDQSASYGDYIERVKSYLENRSSNLVDVYLGNYGDEDTPLGIVGAQALNKALNLQFAENLKRETIGLINTDGVSLLRGDNLLRKNFDITVRKNPIARSAEFLSELGGFEFPFSYIPPNVFGIYQTARLESDGDVTWVGSNLSLEQRTEDLLDYTGVGQQSHLISLLKLNKYKPQINGKRETLEERSYVPVQETLDTTDFEVSINKAIGTGLGYYEPYGVISIHKNRFSDKMVDDYMRYTWTTDIPNPDSVGWTLLRENKFNKKSLLFKTQEILNSGGASQAFIDLNDKEFTEYVGGDPYTISRGDSTTASGAYIADDGTPISKGEYFRVWTKTRGYNKLSRALRHRGLDNGDKRSVLNDNGIPNYAPTVRTTSEGDDLIKRYMFSLENLAWADNLDDLPLCEQGAGDPVTGTRGRIMWFPPYNLNISEDNQANLEPTQFIGRSEPIYTYNNSERTATLDFSIIVDHPDIVHQLVGEKTQFWERYFKGDKLVQEQALAGDLAKKRLSRNEIDQLEKTRKRLQPKEKVADEVVVTKEQKEKNDKEETKEKENTGVLGEVAFSIYYPNNVTVVPRSTFLDGNQTGDANITFVPDPNLTLNELIEKNVGYEDGGASESIGTPIITTDGVKVTTSGGIKYVDNKTGRPINKTYTYDRGKLIDNTRVCRESGAPRGYSDKTNLGLNTDFYFFWRSRLQSLVDGATRVKVSIVGNASGAKPTGANNTTLSQRRAQSALEWFNSKAAPYLSQEFPNLEFSTEIEYKGDEEDIEKIEQGLTACEDCDRSDVKRCKATRRVDIYIRVLGDEDEGDSQIESGQDRPLEDIEDEPKLTEDTDELNTDELEEDPVDPSIDPNILKKLVYTECDFFKYLEINEPIAYQTISERIKYFHPSYHSITPQGFNSRLTFLHQCLRQGNSIGRDGIDNFKNLAFGRPPVCILRIGDFYHTRVMIQSMSITYDDQMQWDLNPEGIGVQPMYANISLGLKILGGSSMSAPINRLQNALSFNYYANTEMYDARADSIVFKTVKDEQGNIDETETFGSEGNAQILDGIKLSSITNNTEDERKKQLAQIRKQSRVFLDNQVNVNQDTENLGQVANLLEAKKRLGVALSETEKIQQKTFEQTSSRFNTTEIEPITVTEIKNSMSSQLVDENSLLNKSIGEKIEAGESTDQTELLTLLDKLESTTVDNPNQVEDEDVKEILQLFNQLNAATVTSPEELTQKYNKQVAEDYLRSYNAIYLDFD